MICRELIICGNARTMSNEELEGHEVWALHTGVVWGADRRWDFHGLDPEVNLYRFSDIPIDELHALGLPLTNSICILVAWAAYSGMYDSIQIKGSPLRAKEYTDRKADLAFVCGWAKGKGIRIHWEGSQMDFINIYMGGNK